MRSSTAGYRMPLLLHAATDAQRQLDLLQQVAAAVGQPKQRTAAPNAVAAPAAAVVPASLLAHWQAPGAVQLAHPAAAASQPALAACARQQPSCCWLPAVPRAAGSAQ